MDRYYEQGLPASNYQGALDSVALGSNNHMEKIFIDNSNEYGARLVIRCWSELDDEIHWYSVRDHKGDVFVAKIVPSPEDEKTEWLSVWEADGRRIL